MQYPLTLGRLWIRRISDEPRWWVDSYEKAVERIEDHSDDVQDGKPNPYWLAPADEASACPGPVIVGFDGSEETPDELRERAFELLALADLAEVADVALALRDSQQTKEPTDG